MLDVRGLHVRYGSLLAVDNLDLHVDEGEIVVLIGANGAGKSSAVNAIAGFYVGEGRESNSQARMSAVSIERSGFGEGSPW